jgi:hypothetical protein
VYFPRPHHPFLHLVCRLACHHCPLPSSSTRWYEDNDVRILPPETACSMKSDVNRMLDEIGESRAMRSRDVLELTFVLAKRSTLLPQSRQRLQGTRSRHLQRTHHCTSTWTKCSSELSCKNLSTPTIFILLFFFFFWRRSWGGDFGSWCFECLRYEIPIPVRIETDDARVPIKLLTP